MSDFDLLISSLEREEKQRSGRKKTAGQGLRPSKSGERERDTKLKSQQKEYERSGSEGEEDENEDDELDVISGGGPSSEDEMGESDKSDEGDDAMVEYKESVSDREDGCSDSDQEKTAPSNGIQDARDNIYSMLFTQNFPDHFVEHFEQDLSESEVEELEKIFSRPLDYQHTVVRAQ